MTQWEENHKEIDSLRIEKQTKDYGLYAIRLLHKEMVEDALPGEEKRKVYIGLSKNVKNRWTNEIYVAFKNNDRCYNLPLSRFFRKYTKSNKSDVKKIFEFIVIAEFDTAEEVKKAEIKYIEKFKTNIYRFGNLYGYNLTDGGDGGSGIGIKHTEKTKKKLSDLANIRRDNGINAKISWSEVNEIRFSFFNNRQSIKKLSEKFAIDISCISLIIRNEIWIDECYIPNIDLMKEIHKLDRGNAKLTIKDVSDIRTYFITSTFSVGELAKKYKMDTSTIADVVNNKIWIDKNYNISDDELNEIKHNNCYSILNKEKIKEIRFDFFTGNFSYDKLAEKYGITKRYVQRIIYDKKYFDENYNPDLDLIKKISKANNSKIKVNEDICRNIRNDFITGNFHYSDLIDKYKISKETIYSVIYNKIHVDANYNLTKEDIKKILRNIREK